MDSKSQIILNQIGKFINQELKIDKITHYDNWGSINDLLKQNFSIQAKRSERETFEVIVINKKTQSCSQMFLIENFQNLLISQELEELVIYTDFYNEYQLLEPIFEKKIYKCKNYMTGSVFAAKFLCQQEIMQEKLKQNQFLKLNQVLNHYPHRNILNIKKFYQSNQQLIGITEYLEGGNLYQVFQHNHFKFSLVQIKAIMKSILLALNHLHQNGIMHRDIKLSNIVFRDKLDLKTLKIIDFEFATFLSNPHYSDCGTEGYIAPEVRLMQDYDQRCDIYSAGIIFYILVFQQRPKASQFQFDSSRIQYQVEDIEEYEIALDLMKNMLEQNYLQRLTSQQCLDHEFFYQVDYNGPIKMNSLIQLNFKNPFHQFKSFPTS